MDFLAPVTPESVKNAKSLARYAQQVMGMPLPRSQDYKQINKQIKGLFQQYPNANFETLVKIVHWALNKRKRFAHLNQLIASYRYAWADGALPELDGSTIDPRLVDEIDKALAVEKDEEWRTKLIRAQGSQNKMAVLRAWKASSPSLA